MGEAKFERYYLMDGKVWTLSDSRSSLFCPDFPYDKRVEIDSWDGCLPKCGSVYGLPCRADGTVKFPFMQAAKSTLPDAASLAKALDPVAVNKPEKSGGSVDYYQVRITDPTTKGRDAYTAECNDIIEALGMNYAEGNAFKALWRSCAERTLGKKKAGGDAVYDAEKIVFFGQRILTQRKENNAA